jgi:hypothetical protein
MHDFGAQGQVVSRCDADVEVDLLTLKVLA